MASLIQRTAQKRKNKEKIKPSSSEETVQAKVVASLYKTLIVRPHVEYCVSGAARGVHRATT